MSHEANMFGAACTLPMKCKALIVRGEPTEGAALLHINIQLTEWVRAFLAMLFGCITLLTVATSIDPLRRFAPVAGGHRRTLAAR